jgi:hypothetical protein
MIARTTPFWDRATKGDGCWIWQAARNSGGYGEYRGGYAHRYAYEQAVGPIPPGMHVLHRCDNPPCINPAHLWVGTNLDNVRDAQAKGRILVGEQRHNAKLSREDVLAIREARDVPIADLAARYGVHRASIHRVRRGDTWGWLVERAQMELPL